MPAETVEEKRRFRRIFYNAEALLVGDGIELPCRVVDISIKGCLLEFDQAWSGSPDKLYVLTLSLSPEVSISMNLSIARSVGSRVGFRCEHIDIDSMTNLRRLVELNLGNSELLGRELTALGEL